jgi:endonuclease YncB( thermonuclease family)
MRLKDAGDLQSNDRARELMKQMESAFRAGWTILQATRPATLAMVVCIAAALSLSASAGVAGQSAERPNASISVAKGDALSARVTRVIDGDTLDAVVQGRGIRVRVEGIDCPESGQPFSQVARNFTRTFAFDQFVVLKVVDIDRYGRLVARVTNDGKDLSVELVTRGLAWHYTDYSSDQRLAAAERDARATRRGLWVDANVTPPWVARRAKSSAPGPLTAGPSTSPPPSRSLGPFSANVRSGVYHAESCRNADCKNCTRQFASEAEAQAAGFRPAGDCVRSSR